MSGNEVVARSGFAAVKYDFTENFSAFGQILLGRSESNQGSNRGGGSLQDGWFATIYRENAFLPANVAAQTMYARLGFAKVGTFTAYCPGGAPTRKTNV